MNEYGTGQNTTFTIKSKHRAYKAQVAQRAEAGQVNVAVEAPTKTVSQIILTNTFTYFNFVFAILALLLILVGSFRELTFYQSLLRIR